MEDAIQSLTSPSSERRQALILEQLRKEEVVVSTRDPDLAFLIEFTVTALFGTMGLGYLYSGLGVFGLSRLVIYWLALIFFFVFVAICPPVICLAIPLLPLHILLAYVSANDLKTTLRRAQGGGVPPHGPGGTARASQVFDTPPLDPLAAFERDLAATQRPSSDDPLASADREIDPHEEAEAEAESIAEMFEGAQRDAYSTIEDGDRDADFDVEAARTRLESAAAEHEAQREIDPEEVRAARDETIAEALDSPGDTPFSVGEDGDRDSDLDTKEIGERLEAADAEQQDEPRGEDEDERDGWGGE